VDHDLFNHDGLTEDGIAEAFIEFAKKENLSFFEIPPANATPLIKGDRGGAFDAVKYQQLMDRLEAVELSLSDVLDNNIYFRIDSEYYYKRFMVADKILRRKNCQNINEFATVTDGEHGSPDLDKYSGIIYLSGKNVKENFLDLSDIQYCSEKLHKKNLRSSVKVGNILMSIVGTVGNASVIHEKFIGNTDRNVATIKDINLYFSPYFISTFINSYYGRYQTERFSTGNVQPLLNLLQVKSILIPKLDQNFQIGIKKLVETSHSLKSRSLNFYQQAEDLLLTELGLKDWQPTEESIAVKSFSESFLSSGRLDAEYYQPKYDEIDNYFKDFKLIKIRDLINYPVSSGATPKAGGDDYTDKDDGIPFIRAVDLKDGEVDTNNFIFIKRYVHDLTLKKTKVKKNDVLFSIAGTVGRCAIFDHDFEANINQAVSILRFDEAQVKRLYLIVFFNSEIGKIYVSKYARQGLQTNLNLNEVSDLRIPILDYNLQGEISKKVQDSFDIKAKSKQLLQIAKIGVEKAIETDEETATAWINQQLESLGVNLI
jgi:restriction endonuclease S subunit